jgi:SAM-dependent methyltransferase
MKTFSAAPGEENRLEVVCPLCGSGSRRRLYSGGGYEFVRCKACSLAYQNPQPVFVDLKRRYGPDYFRYELENEDNFFRLMLLGLGDIGFERLRDPGCGNSRFLDIGCATGRLLEHMRDAGWHPAGVELCRESAAYAGRQRGLDIRIGSLFEADFPDEHFSVIHFSHLLEHVPAPADFLREVRRILAPDGLAVITTPNIAGLQARLFRSRWRSAIADHLTLFSVSTLKRMLALTGFRVLRVVTWGGLAEGSAPALLKQPLDRLAKRFGFGDVMLFLAAKDSWTGCHRWRG